MNQKTNFLNIQTHEQGFDLFNKLPTLDEKTKKKYLAGIGFYFQEKMELNELSPADIHRFFTLYPQNDNVRFSSHHLESYVKTLIKKQELPSFVISWRQFSEDFKDNYLLDFLELVAQKGTPEQLKSYIKDNQRVLNLALQGHKIQQPKLLEVLFEQNPLKISKYPHYSDEQKLALYKKHFDSHQFDTPLVPTIFQDNHNLPPSIRETVWDWAQSKIELYSLNPNSHMFAHRDRIENGFTIENNFASFFSTLIGHNFIYLSYAEKHYPEKLKDYLFLPQKIGFIEESFYDGESQTFYHINGYQAAFIQMSKIARESGNEAYIHSAQQFALSYEAELLAPILKDKNHRLKPVSYIDLLDAQNLSAALSFLSKHTLSQQDKHTLASNIFSEMYNVQGAQVFEKSVIKDMLADLPVDLIKYYYGLYEKKAAKKEIPKLGPEYQEFIGIFLERDNLAFNLSEKIDSSPKSTFKV